MFISAFPDGRLTELLKLDCGEYIMSEQPERYPYGPIGYTQFGYTQCDTSYPNTNELRKPLLTSSAKSGAYRLPSAPASSEPT